MDNNTMSLIIMGASKIISEFIRYRPLQTGPAALGSPEPESAVRVVASTQPKGEVVTRGVSTDETIAYQKEQLVKQITLMEMHLAQGCKINGKACDCCEKHPQTIEALAEETLGITGDPLYKEIIVWCQFLKPRTTADASASGKYDKDYPTYATEGRRLRKALMGSSVIPKPAISEIKTIAEKVTAGEISREQAVARVKEIAMTYGDS